MTSPRRPVLGERVLAPPGNRTRRAWIHRILRARPASALLDDRFQMIKVGCKRFSSLCCQPAARLRTAADELLVDGNVAGIFELLEMNAQIAVCHLQHVA